MFYITAHTNDRARLIVSQSRTSDPEIAALIESNLKKRGFLVLSTFEEG
jgi:hypothetical protein